MGVLLGLMATEALGASKTTQMMFSVNKRVQLWGLLDPALCLQAASSRYPVEECIELQR